MKVAFVTSYLSRRGGGGIVTAIEAASRALREAGTEIEVLGLADEDWRSERDEWLGASVRGFTVHGPAGLGRAPDLRRALLGGNYDIVHSHGIWMHPSADVAAWAARTRRPYLIAPHGMLDSWAIATSRAKKRIARLLYEDRHLRGAHAFQALCQPEAEAIRAFGLTQPIHIVANGVDLPELPRGANIEARTLLFLGRLHRKKNLAALVEAFAAQPHRDWRLVIAGWDQHGYENELRETALRHGIADRIDFPGALTGAAKARAFAQASAFVLPSLSEGLPMAVLEAWSYGLPVGMTPACNIGEGFAAGAAHELSTDPATMAIELAQMLGRDRAELAAMGAKGRELVEQNFTWPAVAARLRDLYARAIAG